MNPIGINCEEAERTCARYAKEKVQEEAELLPVKAKALGEKLLNNPWWKLPTATIEEMKKVFGSRLVELIEQNEKVFGAHQ